MVEGQLESRKTQKLVSSPGDANHSDWKKEPRMLRKDCLGFSFACTE
jgi:hypothetical protein